MPTVTRLASCTITMYAGDHLPPHFHVRTHDGGRETLVMIAALDVLSGSIHHRDLDEAMTWAKPHQHTLATQWKELNP